MYADKNKKTGKISLCDLSDEELGIIEFGLSLIPLNSNDHEGGQQLWEKIDSDLKD